MKRFDHISAQNYEEAAQLLAQGEEKRDAMAGGTDLLGTYKDRLLEEYPEAVVSLKKIPGYIREEKEELVLGAGTTLSEIAQSDAVKAYAQALAQAAYSVASPLIRNTATLGGNVCQDVRCWYYRYPDSIGGRLNCKRKGGATCYAIAGECARAARHVSTPALRERISRDTWQRFAKAIGMARLASFWNTTPCR